MSDFYLGFAMGALVIGIITAPFLTYFGSVFFNIRKIEQSIQKETEEPEKKVELDKDDAKVLEEAEELLRKQNEH